MMTDGKTKGRTRNLLWLWAGAAAIAALFAIYWAVVARQVEQSITSALGDVRGLVVEEVTVGGFPYRHTVKIIAPRWENPAGASFSAAHVQLTSDSFNPSLWMLDHIEQGQFAVAGDLVRPLQPTALRVSLRLSQTGLVRLSATADAIRGTPVQEGDRGWSLDASSFHLVRDDADPERYGVALELTNLVLPREPDGAAMILGDTIQRAVVRGPLDKGAALNTSPQAWQRAGGRFDVMVGELSWGPLQLKDTRGQLSLDAEGRWQGTMSTNGALVPAGVPVDALSRDVDARIENGEVRAYGLRLVRLPAAF